MATLTEVSYLTRKGMRVALAFAILVIISPILWGAGKKMYLMAFPPPPAAPTVRYGKLPKVQFGESEDSYKPQIKLETVDGKLPKVATVGKVYFVEVNKSRLLQLDNINTKAKSLGFTEDGKELDDLNYNFIHSQLPAQLVVNIIYNQYSYKYDWTNDQEIYSDAVVANNDQAFLEAKNFFQGLDLLAADLAEGIPKYSYFAAQPPEMIPVSSLSEANFVRVDIFRADKDGLKIVTANGDMSPVSIVFSANRDQGKRVVEANYTYSKIIEDDFATYPLKSIELAWDELGQGAGFISKKAGENVTIRKAYLAYYESDQPQEFLQLVFVFEGDNGFMAYVPAITAEYIQ